VPTEAFRFEVEQPGVPDLDTGGGEAGVGVEGADGTGVGADDGVGVAMEGAAVGGVAKAEDATVPGALAGTDEGAELAVVDGPHPAANSAVAATAAPVNGSRAERNQERDGKRERAVAFMRKPPWGSHFLRRCRARRGWT
jgi:hypothetical protein